MLYVDGSAILLTLTPESGNRFKSKGDRYWTYFCQDPRVSVGSNRKTMVPPTKKNVAKGHSSYFADRIPSYRQVAVRARNNAILFFKYKLRQPLLQLVDEQHQGLGCPILDG